MARFDKLKGYRGRPPEEKYDYPEGITEADCISEEAEAEAAEAEGLYPELQRERRISANNVIDRKIIQDAKEVGTKLNRQRIRELQERWPDAQMDFSKPYSEVFSREDTEYKYSQKRRGKVRFYNSSGMDVTTEVKNAKRRKT